MRTLAVVVALGFVAGCPSTKDVGDTETDAGVDAGAPDAGAPVCPTVPTCTTTITFHGSGSSVSLRGDFAADGWTTGVPMTPTADGTGFSATIPVSDQQIVLYKFVVDGTWLADATNPRSSPDGNGGVNSVVKTSCDACPPRAALDWHDAIMYFIMIDRFNNGDPTNDAPVVGADAAGNYQGGDFAGIQQKIESGYFTTLGINTIWITSPVDNTDLALPGDDGHTYSGYHGYWPSDETKIESRFGTEAELKAMIASAHAHGLQIILDYVMNHTSSDSPTYTANNACPADNSCSGNNPWFTADNNGAGGNNVCGEGDPNFDTVCWFESYLPTFNFNDNSAARAWSVDNAVTWAKQLGVDGFRLDAVKQVSTQWIVDLRARVTPELVWNQPFYMVGETFDGDRALIKSYVDKQTMLDGQFDFPLRGQVLSTLLRRDGAMSDLTNFLATNDGYYGSGAIMSTFLGNHDVPRAIELALDSPLFGAWDNGANLAWSGQPALPESVNPFQRLAVAYALIYTMPGVPMIYYGDEYGQPGAGDPDNRRFMQWSGYTANQTWLHDRIAGLIKMRKAHPATRTGTRTMLGVTQDTAVFSMSTAGDTVYVAMNRGDNAEAATGLPAGTYIDLVSGDTVLAPVSVPARSALVLGAQ